MNATITVTNCKQRFNDSWVDYKPGDQLVPDSKGKFSIQVGYRMPSGDWENYYVNDASLFQYFLKGATLNVEYKSSKSKTTGKEYRTITGLAPDAQQPSSPSAPAQGRTDATGRSIELQVLAKCYAEMNDGPTTATEFADWVVSAHALIFAPPIEKMVEKVKEAFDAEEMPLPNDDDIPFGPEED